VYADVFDHPPLQLASQCPVWSDMLPVDTVAQLREHWLVASVVAGQSHHCMTARFWSTRDRLYWIAPVSSRPMSYKSTVIKLFVNATKSTPWPIQLTR